LDLSIIIPALNEADNIRALLPEIDAAARDLRLQYEIVIVDGGSRDETVLAALQSSSMAKVITQQNPGYGGAIKEGFAAAKGNFILTMDADLSHDPAFLLPFWSARHQAEVVVGSRYVRGGSAEMPLLRKIFSRILNVFFRRGLSLPWKDISSGFRLYQSSAVKGLKLSSIDFDVLEEILIRLYAAGYRIVEVPIRYKPRTSGSSHVKLIRFGWAYLRTFWRMRRLRSSIQPTPKDNSTYGANMPLQR
jgi:glycosyltransferase involved in cell wall biosynthesis